MAKSGFGIFIAALVFLSTYWNSYASETPPNNPSLNIAIIQKFTGKTGQFDQDKKIYKITIPRDDLNILMSGMPMTSERGLASWVAFKKIDSQASVNGDLILLQDQINPVMSVALANGLQITGLHNPYLWDSPRVMLMRIKGEGSELQLANAIGQVLKKTEATRNGGGDFPLGNFYFPKTTLNTHKIDAILGQTGQFKDDVYRVEFSGNVKTVDTETHKMMAINTWAAFAGSDDEAVINGSFMLHKTELQPVLMKLRNAKMYILGIDQRRMDDDDQDVVSVNFWGVGNAQALARALRTVFLVAQSNSSSDRVAERTSSEQTPMFLAKETSSLFTPVVLFQNNYCGYVKDKALYTSLAPEQSQVQSVQQQTNPTVSWSATFHAALQSTHKIIQEKMASLSHFFPTDAVIFYDAEALQAVPSAKAIFLRFPVVKNELAQSLAVLAMPSPTENAADSTLVRQPLLSETREIFVPSAARLLSTLSVVQHHDIEILSMQSEKLYFSITQFIAFYKKNVQSDIHAILAFVSNAEDKARTRIHAFSVSYAESARSWMDRLSTTFKE